MCLDTTIRIKTRKEYKSWRLISPPLCQAHLKKYDVTVGESVKEDDELVILEAMKMENQSWLKLMAR